MSAKDNYLPRCRIPPLPQEKDLFCAPHDLSGKGDKCFLGVVDRLLATLPGDTEVTLYLDITARKLKTNIKRL